MKSFTTNFTAEKNKTSGISPVWILECPFPGTGTIYISDIAVSLPHWKGGVSVLSLVSDWGSIDEDISSGNLAVTKVSDFALDLIVDPNANPNLETILWNPANKIETTDLILSLWFRDLNDATDPPVSVWRGNIIDFTKTNETTLRCNLVDQSVRIDRYVGTKINLTNYPNADPAEVGRVKNIIYGSNILAPAHLLESGAVTSLKALITASQTDFYLSDGTGLTVGNVIQINEEQILIGAISSTRITACSRAYNGTVASAHSRGAVVWEVMSSPFVYMRADHPVHLISAVFVEAQGVLVDITSDCLLYTGKPGSIYGGYNNRYAGKSVITIANLPSIQQKVQLALSDPLTINGGQAADNISVMDDKLISDNKGATDNISVSSAPTTKSHYPNNYVGPGWNNLVNVMDGSDATKADYYINGQNGTNVAFIYFPSTNYGTILTQYVILKVSSLLANGTTVSVKLGNGSFQTFNLPAGSNVMGTFRVAFQGGTWDSVVGIGFNIPSPGYTSVYIHEVEKVVEYYPTMSKAGGVSLTGSISRPNAVTKTGQVSRLAADAVTMSGSSTANTLVGGRVMIAGDGWEDADGSITGSPGSVIERCDHVVKHFAFQYAGWPTAKFYTDAAPYFGTLYKFSGIISEYKTFKQWAADMAWQCRCYFRLVNDQMQLLWRPDTLIADKTISRDMVQSNNDGTTTMTVSRSPLDELINIIDIHFNRDWTANGPVPYQGLSSGSDVASIDAYGEKENPELFNFDFVVSQGMVDAVRDFYLTRYSSRPRLVAFNLFLNNSELEFADAIAVTPLASLLCEVQKANLAPGSGEKKRPDRINIVGREYLPGAGIPYRLTEDGYYRLTEDSFKRIVDN